MRCVTLVCLLIAPTAFAAADAVTEARRSAERGKFDEAIKLLDGALVADAKNADAYELRANVFAVTRQPAKAVEDFTKLLALRPNADAVHDLRGSEYFKLGKIKESLDDFDRYLAKRPEDRPGHWRRGITLYYAGRFEDGAKQFNAYEKVDTNDVENSVWHYLCNARAVGPDKARAALLKIGFDRRVPLMTAYDLFAGKAKPEDVLKAAEAVADARAKKAALFYAHLYLGLYFESVGDATKSLDDMTKAAEEFVLPGYMHEVARVHVQLRKPVPEKKP